jgi:hypothetical protein
VLVPVAAVAALAGSAKIVAISAAPTAALIRAQIENMSNPFSFVV